MHNFCVFKLFFFSSGCMLDNIGPAREEGSAMYIFVSTYSATEFVKYYLYSLYLKKYKTSFISYYYLPFTGFP